MTHAIGKPRIGPDAGHGLAEHASPGEATLDVLRGQVRLSEDGVVMLTVVAHRATQA